MKQIRDKLTDIARKLVGVNNFIRICQRRIKVWGSRALRAHEQAEAAERRARQLRQKQPRGYKERVAFQEARAARAHGRAYNRHLKAQWWIGRLKKEVQKRENLEDAEDHWQRERRKWEAEHGPTVNGNTVQGGSPHERLKAGALRAAALHASGQRHSFYSQAGWWTAKYGITGEPWGARSDCSQWVTSIYHSAGMSDPNGANYSGGFTGTLKTHGRAVTRSQLSPGDLVIYGYGNGFHCEMYVGPGSKTIGHGSAPVDAGTVDMIPGYKSFRSYR